MLVGAGCGTDVASTHDLVIKNVTLIDGTGAEARPAVDVAISDGRIVRIATSAAAIMGTQTIDGSEKVLIPGLINAHAHPFPIESNLPRFVRFGVTSILVPGCSDCTNEALTRMRQLSESDSIPAPNTYHTSQHFTMEGRHPVKTYVTDNWVEGKSVFFVRDTLDIPGLVEEVAGQSNIGIKVTIEDGPSPPFVERMPTAFVAKIVAEARKHDLEVFAHVSDMEEVRIAAAAGVDHILHFVGVDINWERDRAVIQELRDRDVSWVTTLMIDKSFFYPARNAWIDEIVRLNVYDEEEIGRLRASASPEESIQFLSEIYGISNPTLDSVIRPQLEDLRGLYDMGFNLVIGTDTGNDFVFPGISVHEELELMAMGGLFEPSELIKMATHNSAKMLGVLDEVGTVEVGKNADLVLLNKNPLEDISNTRSIYAVFVRGRQVFAGD